MVKSQNSHRRAMHASAVSRLSTKEVGTLPLMSVARNFILAAEPTKGWGPFRRLDLDKASAIAIAGLRERGINRITDGSQLVVDDVGRRTAGSGNRPCALHFGCTSSLVLDEPTAALGVRESADPAS